jgi:hypothetical protein
VEGLEDLEEECLWECECEGDFHGVVAAAADIVNGRELKVQFDQGCNATQACDLAIRHSCWARDLPMGDSLAVREHVDSLTGIIRQYEEAVEETG